ncbi:hypothetical protein NDI56_09730 [Haloarcula sp. S1CR25-12]|uniref:Uncharacterized protein n=1 Tax=Haloarcula saliterrae TaxID=2950534 RepID=A0ABU2FD86_9EURY|nr:hypothetical protein [Haloarcula sp. S1CR25-12]MDS0259670.1 hypothetical protein [Haloarcula sp. S1CR25-12]
MTNRHAVFVVCVAVALLVSPTIMAQETATATRNTTNGSGGTAGMGAQLTAFTQSSSAAANDSVENGMWRAGFDQSDAGERTNLVRDRAGTLERRLDRLQRQNESLRAEYENGSLPQPAYIARQSRLSARIDGLRAAVNDTDEAAARAGVNDSRLERLRENASELDGPEVAAIARGLGGGPPADRGPPDEAGERGPPDDARGPPDEAGERGPPDDARGPPANRSEERGETANRSEERGETANRSEERGEAANRTDGPGQSTDRSEAPGSSGGGDTATNETSAAGQPDSAGGATDGSEGGAADRSNGPDTKGSESGGDDTKGSGSGGDDTKGSGSSSDDTKGSGSGSDGAGGDRADEAPGRSGN